MNNEIKEKIYKLRAYLGTEENWLLNDIVDYITNLQEKNEGLKKIVKILNNEIEAYVKHLGYEIYKNKKLQGESNED